MQSSLRRKSRWGAGAGGADEADEVDAQVSRALQLEHEDETAAGNLGCMLPLFDMFEHKCGHPIVWEAGRGGVRFRCRAPVPKGAPLHNNYGAKGNEELLNTYNWFGTLNAEFTFQPIPNTFQDFYHRSTTWVRASKGPRLLPPAWVTPPSLGARVQRPPPRVLNERMLLALNP
jgi:hypothetical protein